MSKNHPSDLRQGVGCIRIKRPNRGRAAKILSNGVWIYGCWRSRQGRTYQLFGVEGVAARLSNNINGELRCVIQNDNPEPDKVRSYEPRPASTHISQGYKDEIPYGNSEYQNLPMSSSFYPGPFPTETATGTALVRSEGQPEFECAQSSFTSSSFTRATGSPLTYPAYAPCPAQYAQSSGQIEMEAPPRYEDAYGDHLSQLEMRYPSSAIWQPLAQGERRRRTAITPMDYPMQNSSTVSVPAMTEHTGWSQYPWVGNIDQNPMKSKAGVSAVDYGFLPGDFNVADVSMTHVDGDDIYEMLELEGGDTYNAPTNFEGCLCEECQPVAAAATTAGNPEYYSDRSVPQSLWRRHSF